MILPPIAVSPNPVRQGQRVTLKGRGIENLKIYSMLGELLTEKRYGAIDTIELIDHQLNKGLYLLVVNDKDVTKLLIN